MLGGEGRGGGGGGGGVGIVIVVVVVIVVAAAVVVAVVVVVVVVVVVEVFWSRGKSESVWNERTIGTSESRLRVSTQWPTESNWRKLMRIGDIARRVPQVKLNDESLIEEPVL